MTNLACVADTFIISSAPDNNAGGDTGNTAGRDNVSGVRRALFRFDLSGIPSGSTITSAELQLRVVKVPPGSVNSSFEIHRLLAAWEEGTKTSSFPGNNGAAASANETTWNSRRHGTAAWTSPGALDDVVATASAATPVAGVGLYSWTGADVTGDVQAWVDQPSSNFGWLVKSDDEATAKTVRDLGSRESTSPPLLIVGFSPPAPPTPPDILTSRHSGVSPWPGSRTPGPTLRRGIHPRFDVDLRRGAGRRPIFRPRPTAPTSGKMRPIWPARPTPANRATLLPGPVAGRRRSRDCRSRSTWWRAI